MDHRAFDLSENNSPFLRPPHPIASQGLDSFTSTASTSFFFLFGTLRFYFSRDNCCALRVSDSLPLCFLCTNNRSITQPDRSSIGLTGSISIYGKLIKQRGASSLLCNHLSGSVLLIQLHLSTVILPLLSQWISAAILKHFGKVNYCTTTAQATAVRRKRSPPFPHLDFHAIHVKLELLASHLYPLAPCEKGPCCRLPLNKDQNHHRWADDSSEGSETYTSFTTGLH